MATIADAPRPAARNGTLIFVAHASHVSDDLAAGHDDAVWVSSDWLLWQELIDSGRPAVLFEEALSRWEADEEKMAREFMLRVNDPAFDGDEDVTLYRGVSLGQIALRPAILFRAAALRIEVALRELIREFEPKRIVYVDSRAETVGLTTERRYTVASLVCAEAGIECIDRRPDRPVPLEDLPMLPEANLKAPDRRARVSLRAALSRGAEIGFDLLSRARAVFAGSRPKALITINTSMTRPLLDGFVDAPHALAPVLFFRTQPKNIGFLLRAICAGAMFIAHPRTRPLAGKDRDAVASIHARLRKNLAAMTGPANTVVAAAMLEFIGDGERLFRWAAEINAAERLLRRLRPSIVVIDTPKNPPNIFYAELAAGMRIAVDYIWHSPMMPETFATQFMGGDPRRPATATRCLSWGNANDRWLDVAAPGLRSRFVGSPIAGNYIGHKPNAHPRAGKRALILEYSIVSRWLASLNATKYEYFVDAVHILRELGFEDIAIKLHPGRPSQRYYERIRDHFGLECRVLKTERLHEVLKDFDVVIGPIHSGATFEAMAAGKEVYAFWCGDDATLRMFYSDYGLLRSIFDLPDAISHKRCIDNDKILRDVYGGVDADEAIRLFWSALAAPAKGSEAKK